MTQDELHQLSAEQCVTRIKMNFELLPLMLGELYPSILRAEIYALRDRYCERTGEVCPA